MRIFICTSDVTMWALRGCLWLLERHWPAHPPVVVAGYTRPELPAGVEFYRIGEFADYPADKWSDGVLAFLRAMRDECFLWTMDDMWLVQDVDDAAVRLLYAHLLANPHLARIDLSTDRLYAHGAFDAGKLAHLDLIGTPPVTPYQLSFQAGLWRRGALVQYLRPGESAGESELRGSHRMTQSSANVLGTRQAPLRYKIVVQHGRVCIDDSGYQVPPVAFAPGDRDELERLGYLWPPEPVNA